MSRSVRISWKTAQNILKWGTAPGAETELRAAMKPKRSVKASRVRKAGKKKTKRQNTADVRELVAKRAGLVCECGCGRWFRGFGGAAQMDHFEGISRSETLETCWMLREDCHRAKHRDANPRAWAERFMAHCGRQGYARAAQKVRMGLEADALIAEAGTLSRGMASLARSSVASEAIASAELARGGP